MYLGSNEIKRRILEEKLLENCSIENVQGAGYDMKIEKLFSVDSSAFLGTEERRLPELCEVPGPFFKLDPDKYYLCLTRESVNMPEDLIAFILQRSTLFRCGVSLRTAVVDPGYKGALTIGIKNEGPSEFSLEQGARIAQIVFSELRGDAVGYSGKYQGGKLV
ncbi:MAG: dCTP deaminase [Candidatus Hydrothermarchaeaceae archaeon]